MASQNPQPLGDPPDRIVGTGPVESTVDDDPDTAPVLRRRPPTPIPKLQGRRTHHPYGHPGPAGETPAPPPVDPERSAHRKAWWLSTAAAVAIVMIATGIVLGVGHTSATTRSGTATAAASALPPATEGAGSITSAAPEESHGGPDDTATHTVAARSTSPSPEKSKAAPKGLANPSGADLALRKPVAASGSEGPAWSPAEAVDGDLTTRWSSAFADPQWIRVDLGALRQIKQVTLTWERSYAVAFAAQTSADGKTWKSVYRTGAGRGGAQTIKTPGAVGRYLRIYGTQRVSSYGYSLFEIDVR